jgi:2-polyprenyl-3-methyl-5-hydroxy-6-metoxy-1,4-benzoquinol methylase
MASASDLDERQIARNASIHDRLAQKYDAGHGEIFNDVEQARIRAMLERAVVAVRTDRKLIRALDFGCGSGNLIRHLVALGLEVTAADVSSGCLHIVRSRFSEVGTLPMNGRDLSNVADGAFDLIATYSVLHHVPDYLMAVREMARVCSTGGVIVLDHERNDEYWAGTDTYRSFRSAALKVDWRKYLKPSNYYHRVLRLFDPRHSNEGDIHVWPDDHIEWDRIKQLMGEAGFEVLFEDNYLVNDSLYRREVYDRYAGRCSDTKAMAFRKCAA